MVFCIDEAYALAQGGDNDFGQEAIDTLVKMMDDNRDRLVVISQDTRICRISESECGLRFRMLLNLKIIQQVNCSALQKK